MNLNSGQAPFPGWTNALIASLRLSPEEGVAVLTRDAEKYRKATNEFAQKFMGPPGDDLSRCGAGCGLCIDAYGIAQPCMGVRALELTFNVLTHELQNHFPDDLHKHDSDNAPLSPLPRGEG